MSIQRRLLPDMLLLRTFECAARHGNFSRAAEELNLTQSAVSRQIRDLEGQIGLQLFERIRKRVVLSAEGARVLPDVRHLLAEAERMVIRSLAAAPGSVPLRVGTLPTFGARWLVPRLGRFLDLHPEISLTLESRDRPFDFAEEALDLAIHYGQPVWPGAVATFLCSEAVLPVANRDLAGRLAVQEPRDLAQAPLLHLTTRAQLWADWFGRHGVDAGHAFRGARFDQFSMVISAVTAGLGVGLLPSYLIERETREGSLVALLDRPMTTENGYYIMVPEGQRGSETVALFQSWLLSQVGSDPIRL